MDGSDKVVVNIRSDDFGRKKVRSRHKKSFDFIVS